MSDNLINSNIFKYVIATLLFFALAATSEFIFIYNNRPGQLAIVPLKAAQILISKKCSETGVDLINIASYLHSINESKYHENSPHFNYDKAAVKKAGIADQKICDLLHDDEKLFTENSANLLSKLYYRISLLSYQTGNNDLAVSMLNNSISLSPALSYYYIELADLYFERSNEENAFNAFNKCEEYPPSLKHCQKYENEYTISKTYESFGYYEEEINAFFDVSYK